MSRRAACSHPLWWRLTSGRTPEGQPACGGAKQTVTLEKSSSALNEPAHAYYHSPIGPLRISGTEQFIAEVSFHDQTERFPGNKKNLPPLLIHCIEQLIQYFQGERRSFDLPVNQEGTPFQQQVWSELMAIPYGRTISYIDLAVRTGDPKATRAVAGANGKNQVAIIVPCHRVIGANRTLVGYGGGLWRKKWLLDLEMRVAHGVQTLF